MAFHPLNLLRAQSRRGEQYSLLKGCKRTCSFKLLLAKALALSHSSNVQRSGHPVMLQQEVWINDSHDLLINAIWNRHSRCWGSECRYLQHHPPPCAEGQKRYQVPPVTQTGSNSSNTPEKGKICVTMVVSAHSSLPTPKLECSGLV